MIIITKKFCKRWNDLRLLSLPSHHPMHLGLYRQCSSQVHESLEKNSSNSRGVHDVERCTDLVKVEDPSRVVLYPDSTTARCKIFEGELIEWKRRSSVQGGRLGARQGPEGPGSKVALL